MDVMIAMIIVSTGVVAILQLFATGTPTNAAATRLMIATRLAQNVQEYARTLDENGIRNLNGRVFEPVIDSQALEQANFTGWKQSVEIHTTRASDLSLNLPISSTAAGLPKRLIVTVLFHDEEVYKEHWILAPTIE